MRLEVTAAGILLLIAGALQLLGAMAQGLLSASAGLGLYGAATSGVEPWVLGALGLYGIVGVAMTVAATASGGIAGVAGVQALRGRTRQLRGASMLATLTSALWLATTCLVCTSAMWALPLVMSAIALGLALELPIEAEERDSR